MMALDRALTGEAACSKTATTAEQIANPQNAITARQTVSAANSITARQTVSVANPITAGQEVSPVNPATTAQLNPSLPPKTTVTIGLTGRSGCGKSTVTAYLRSVGIPVVDADAVAREILAPSSTCLPKLQAIFGDDICKDNILDRKLLADRAFATKEGTQALNAITHPAIIKRICAEKTAAEQANAPLFVIDGAVIFGTPCEALCDCFAVVHVPYAVSVARIMARDGISEESAKRRLDAQHAQLSDQALCARADYLLEANYDLTDTQQEKEFHQLIDHMITQMKQMAACTVCEHQTNTTQDERTTQCAASQQGGADAT